MCSDLGASNFSCAGIGGAAASLCSGVARIHASPCATLLDVHSVQTIIEEIGLVPDPRGAWLYGSASRFMVKTSNPVGASRVGLWQDPLQIASALVHLARSSGTRIPHIRLYVEVGVFSAWTCVVVSAFLARILPLALRPFRGAAVDLSKSNIARGTFALLARHNMSFVHRGRLGNWLEAELSSHDSSSSSPSSSSATASSSARVGLCFIDANHSFIAARGDYEWLAPRCRALMLHDIQVSRQSIAERSLYTR